MICLKNLHFPVFSTVGVLNRIQRSFLCTTDFDLHNSDVYCLMITFSHANYTWIAGLVAPAKLD